MVSTGRPTYWSTDLVKKSGLLDFGATDIRTLELTVSEALDLTSDHIPIILDNHGTGENITHMTLENSTTDWNFRHKLRDKQQDG